MSTIPVSGKQKADQFTATQFNPGQPGQQRDATLTEKAKEIATTVGDKAKEAASTAVHAAGDAATYVGDKVEGAPAAMGSGLKSLAATIREKTPHEGALGEASAAVANSLEKAGHFLEEEGWGGMGDDVTNLIRRNPVPALLIAAGVGFLLARATSHRS